MTPARVARALQGGYEVTITHSDSPHAALRRLSRFGSLFALEAALQAAQQNAPALGSNLVRWQLRTHDELLDFTGQSYLERDGDLPDACAELARASNDVLHASALYRPAAIARAKVLRHVAVLLTTETARARLQASAVRIAAMQADGEPSRTGTDPRWRSARSERRSAVDARGVALYVALVGAASTDRAPGPFGAAQLRAERGVT